MKICVTGVGMLTSLGFGAVGSCAAIRAGLSRPLPIMGLEAGDEGEAVAVVGFPVQNYAEGFIQAGAWVQLAAGSFEDMVHASDLPPLTDRAFWSRTGLVALAPIVDEERFMWSLEDRPNALLDFYVKPFIDRIGIPINHANTAAVARGHCGLAVGLQKANKLFRTRRVDRVVVVGADSYLDPYTLDWLLENERLKSPENPYGLMPGEAGACILVESESNGKSRNANMACYLQTYSASGSPRGKRPSPDRLGRNLADMIMKMGNTPMPGGEIAIDLNGEAWRANTWGNAQVHLRNHIDFDRCEHVVPCESLGDVGAASGPIALILCVFAFVHDGEQQALVCSLSDDGQVAAIKAFRYI